VFKKKRLVLRYRGSYYDALNGEELEAVEVQDAVIINFDSTNRTFIVKDKKEVGIPFAYRTKGGKFYMTFDLIPIFLREVAYDYLCIPKSVGLVIESPALLIVFLGAKQEVFFSKDEQERKAFLESFFQGIEYKSISLEELIELVVPKPPYALIAVVLFILLGLWFYFIYSMFFSVSEEQVKKVSAPPPPPPPPPQFVDVGFTQAVLDGLFRFPLRPVEAIKTIDFSSGSVALLSIIPEEGFKKSGNVYRKTNVQVIRYAKDIKLHKDVKTCYHLITKYTDDLIYVDKSQVRLLFDKRVPLEEFERFVADVKGCPVSLKGSANLSQNFMKEQVRITVILYPSLNFEAYNAIAGRVMNSFGGRQ